MTLDCKIEEIEEWALSGDAAGPRVRGVLTAHVVI